MKCTYCGIQHADTLDHVVPQAHHPQDFSRKNVVPCCRECNSTLGAKPYYTIADRASYLLSKYPVKYKSLINKPDWRPDEIEELTGRLRVLVETQQLLKDEIKGRLDHLEFVILTAPTIPDIWSDAD